MAYSNSSMVCHTRLSPNCNKPRNHAIDRISIHCVAGNCSVETIGNIFAPSSAQSSSNYGIGTDGRVGMYVEEANRSWCTSSSANDNRAVTIEVSNDGGAPDWHVSDKALATLIDLVTDICKRNGKNKVVWISDKTKALAYNPASGEIQLTVHRWFANKACPGNYLFSKHEYIAAEVNKRLTSTATSGSTYTDVTSNPSNSTPAYEPKAVIWNYLKGCGYNDYAVAGIMGNLYAESGLQPNNLQNTFETKFKMTDQQYTDAVDSGKYTAFTTDGAGYGLAQWTYSSRKKGLLDLAKKKQVSIGDINVQLEWLATELKSYTKVHNTLMSATSVKAASDIVLTDFEAPANANSKKTERAKYSQEYYDKYHGTGVANASKLPYTVRVTTVLNIRKGPSTSYAVNGSIKDNGIYTIVEESLGVGASMWGKLKSGAGWISLDYTKKL